MSSGDPIRQRNIDIAESLYREFKAECIHRGTSMRAGFADALRLWLTLPYPHEGIVSSTESVYTSDNPNALAELAINLADLIGTAAFLSLMRAGMEVAIASSQNFTVRGLSGENIADASRQIEELDRLVREAEGLNAGGNPHAGPAGKRAI